MKGMLKAWTGWMTLGVVALAATACDIDQTRDAELPDVDVDVQGGQLPAWDIDGPDVTVGTTTKTVTVPKLVVVTEEEQVEVPYIDVDVPGEDKHEQTVTVEVEVPNDGYDLRITDVYMFSDRLVVLSQLEDTGNATGQQRVRVSDRVTIASPDLDVRHYVVGDRPAGVSNEQYRFVSSRDEIPLDLNRGRSIYSTT